MNAFHADLDAVADEELGVAERERWRAILSRN